MGDLQQRHKPKRIIIEEIATTPQTKENCN